MLEHREIIQKLLDTRIDKKYLEIGVAGGGNFVAIQADYKVGVDPIGPGKLIKKHLNEACIYHAMPSDAFFMDAVNSSVKYNIIFVDGLHEYEQAYRDIVNSMNCLAPDGVIVVHDCKPGNEVIGLPPRLYQYVSAEVRKQNNLSWTGDVWKAIVRLRSTHDNFLIFTLDCDFGCAIITPGTPESLLHFSLTEIKAMDFDDFEKDCAALLNLKHPDYLNAFLAPLLGKKQLERPESTDGHTPAAAPLRKESAGQKLRRIFAKFRVFCL